MVSRRTAVALIGVGAAVAATLTTLFSTVLRPRPKADLYASRVDKVPTTDPDSPAWERTTVAEIAVAEQSIVKPFKVAKPQAPIKVRALHDGETIAFLLEWRDSSADGRTIKMREFRDACAVMLVKYPAPDVARFMGTKDFPATMLHWKGDWQLDTVEGFQDLEKAFPNVSLDYYPPMKEAVVGGKPPRTLDYPEKARVWLPGWSSGNPISQPTKSTPVEKIVAIGPGSITSLPDQDATGFGRWREGVWKVVLAKKMKASNEREGEMGVVSGSMYAVAFTIWYGEKQDRGARKNPSLLHTLYVD